MTDIAMDMDVTSPGYGDILLVDGGLSLITDAQTELRQAIKQAISIYKGEWFMNMTLGIDYFGVVFTKSPDMAAINAAIVSTIVSVPGIVQLISYNFVPNFTTRKLSVSFVARSTSGIISYTG